MNKIYLVLLILILQSFILPQEVNATAAKEGEAINQSSYARQLRAQGYTCTANWLKSYGSGCDFFCSSKKDEYEAVCYKTSTYFTGDLINPLSINGYIKTQNYSQSWGFTYNSPFIYLNNAPQGPISLEINSDLAKYKPKPTFNQNNGWQVKAQNGEIYLSNQKQDHLFYELAVNKITLNRYGQNFTTRDELINYLKNSNFLTELGFSEIEKKNSLDYFIPKLKSAPTQNYYYLTILDNNSIDEISTLAINPKPTQINKKYFAVYPATVPVTTKGSFVFPKPLSTSDLDYTADVTGEFLVESEMVVLWGQ